MLAGSLAQRLCQGTGLAQIDILGTPWGGAWPFVLDSALTGGDAGRPDDPAEPIEDVYLALGLRHPIQMSLRPLPPGIAHLDPPLRVLEQLVDGLRPTAMYGPPLSGMPSNAMRGAERFLGSAAGSIAGDRRLRR